MTPIEQAAKAHKAEAARWEYIDYRSGDFEIHRDGELKAKGNWRQTPGGQGKCEMERLRDEAAMRAALRALAEMEPTPAMRAAWSKEENECAIHNYGGHPSCEDAFAIGLRAAGSEEANG
jgi:hypothetical protein